MAAKIPRHKVFPSFHNDDMAYKDKFVRMLGGDIVDKSVHDEDIDDTGLKTSTVRRIIRDDHIADASITVVLIGPNTWRRKHVDWEIGSSIRKTKKNSRCGLLGILLPNHPDYHKPIYASGNIPPRLADNCRGEDPYAKIYRWEDLNKPGVKAKIRRWIDEAFNRKDGTSPNNARKAFGKNRSPEATQESRFRGQIVNPVALPKIKAAENVKATDVGMSAAAEVVLVRPALIRALEFGRRVRRSCVRRKGVRAR